MILGQHPQRARVIGIHVRSHVVIAGLGAHLDNFLQILGQRLQLGLVHRHFGGQPRLDEAGEVIVLGDLVEAQRQIVIGADEFGGVERARLQRGKDFARRQIGHRRAELCPHLPAQPRRSEAQPLQVRHPGQLVAEPAARLRAGIARQEPLQPELVVDFVPDFLPAQITPPGRQLPAGHAKRHAGEKAQSLPLVLPVIGRAVAQLGRAVDHRIERLQPRHHFAGGIDLDGQPPATGPAYAVGKVLRAHAKARKVLGPGGHHAPVDRALGNGGRCKTGRGGCAKRGDRGRFEEVTSLHGYPSHGRPHCADDLRWPPSLPDADFGFCQKTSTLGFCPAACGGLRNKCCANSAAAGIKSRAPVLMGVRPQ